MADIISLADTRAKKDEALAERNAVEARCDKAMDDLALVPCHFNTDTVTQYCSTMTESGLTHYAPRFAAYGSSLTGQETFQDLRGIKLKIMESLEDTDSALSKDIREGKLKGAEMRLALALLDGDVGAIGGAAGELTNGMD